MKDRLTEARYALRGHVRCAVYKDKLYTSEERGIRPMLLWLEEDKDFIRGAAVADKIVGRAAAMLMVYGGVAEVFCEVISRGALSTLEDAGIPVTYINTCVAVSNRRGDGICPMERAVAPVKEPEAAYNLLREKVFGAETAQDK